MKYLRKFETEADVQMFVHPNIVLIADTCKIRYNVPLPNGVYIQHVDGRILTTEAWLAGGFANAEANGVAVKDSMANFIISGDATFYGNQKPYDTYKNIVSTSDSDTAKADFNGLSNTNIAFEGSEGQNYIVSSCVNYTFPNGQKGYLPSLGELAVMYTYKEDIISALSVINSQTNINSTSLWSSTQGSNHMSMWRLNFGSGSVETFLREYNSYAIPFTTLEL